MFLKVRNRVKETGNYTRSEDFEGSKIMEVTEKRKLSDHC